MAPPKKEFRLGHGTADENARRAEARANSAKVTGKLPYGVPQPKPDSRWDPRTLSYWRAFGMSDLALVAQPAQWMYAYVCCEVLDRLFKYGFAAGLTKEFNTMSERLGMPRFDLLGKAADEPASDVDEQEAESAVADIRSKFKVVGGNDE